MRQGVDDVSVTRECERYAAEILLAQMTPCDIVKRAVISADSRARNRLMLAECSATGVRADEDVLRGEDTTGITAENPPVL